MRGSNFGDLEVDGGNLWGGGYGFRELLWRCGDDGNVGGFSLTGFICMVACCYYWIG